MADMDYTAHWVRNVVLLWASQLLILAGFDAAMPFVPLMLPDQFGITGEEQRGIFVSIFTFAGVIGYAVSSPIWGKLADKYGVKIMLIRGTFLPCWAFPLMGYVSNIWLFIFLRFFTAFFAGTTVASQMLLVKTTPENKQGFALGVLSTAIWGGAALGNVCGGIIADQFSYQVAFSCCGVLYFIAGLFILFTADAPKNMIKPLLAGNQIRKKETVTTLHKYRHTLVPGFTLGVWLCLTVLFLLNLVRRFDVPYAPMMIEMITGPEKAAYWTGMVNAAVGIGALLSGVVTGYLADHIRPQLIIVPALLLSTILLLVQAFTGDLFIFGSARTLTYFAAGGLAPVFQKILAGATPIRKRGMVFGWAATAGNLGGMCATFIAGAVIYAAGTRATFIAAAILTFLFLPVSLLMIHRTMRQPYYLAHAHKVKSPK